MVRVKICGITSAGDAFLAVDSGADALGFVFYEKSPRNIDPEAAARIAAALPPFVSKVGVFVDCPLDVVRQIVSFCNLDLAQLHGLESPEFCRALFPRAIKAFRIQGHKTLEIIEEYRTSAYLLDAYNPGVVGGTGETFDWEIARTVSAARRIILAGGLTPSNVSRAVALVKPYGVDVSTGVESSPGKKDAELVQAFIRMAKGVKTGK